MRLPGRAAAGLVDSVIVASLLAAWSYRHRSPQAAIEQVFGRIAHHAWVEKRFWGWEFNISSGLSERQRPADSLEWSAWSPTPHWTLVKGTLAPEVHKITVQGREAHMDFGRNVFWIVVDGTPTPPEAPIVAYDAVGDKVYAIYSDDDKN